MKLLIISCLLLFQIFTSLWAQENEVLIDFYQNTADFTKQQLSNEKFLGVVKDKGENYIWFSKMLDPVTKEKSKTGSAAWAIEYEGNTYCHLRYSIDVPTWGLFVKLDTKGRYCLAIIDLNDKGPINAPYTPYGYGLAGALTGILAQKSAHWGKSWHDAEGNKKQFLFSDTKNLSLPSRKYGDNAPFDLLKRESAKYLASKDSLDKKTTDYTVEEITDLISRLNVKAASPAH